VQVVGSGGVPRGGGGAIPVSSGGVAAITGGTAGFTMTLPPAMGGSSAGGASAGGAAGSGNLGGAGGSVGGSAGQSGGGAAGTAGGGSGNVGGAAGSGGSAQSPCDGGKVGTDSSMLRTTGGYGSVKYQLPTSNHIVELKTVLKVPKKPMAMGTLFIWPGLQWLGGPDPAREGNGVLQPVLTWGTSCQMGSMSYNEWWIAGMYVNISTGAAGPSGCAGGDTMNVVVADALDIDIALSGTTWKQTVTDEQTMKTVDFSIDLKGQAQNWAIWDIEQPYGGAVAPPEDVVFTDSVISFASPATSCQPNDRGANDYFSAPVVSADGLHCCIAKITLRAAGVPATTMP
jgi:hypothetical protein